MEKPRGLGVVTLSNHSEGSDEARGDSAQARRMRVCGETPKA